jgi:multidrug efflux system outer membrane protein
VIVANAQIGIAQAARLPTFSLSASYGRDSQSTATLLDAPATIWSLTAGVVGPILDAGKYAARTAQAEARQRQAAAAWRRSVETAFREVADALSATDAAAAAQADLAAGVQAAQEAHRIARSRYANGYGGFLEVLDAQRTLNDANLAWVRNRQSWLLASVELIKAIGGGWQPE